MKHIGEHTVRFHSSENIITQINSGSNKVKLGNTSPTRDFNFVSDTCDAFIAVANSNRTLGKIINSASFKNLI